VCDTLCVRTAGGMLFAKNSDRSPNEAQVVEGYARRSAGSALATQYLTLADAGAHALIGSRPTWLWGFEHGVNEHGLAVGNEKIWTVEDPRTFPPALIGMDLVRLALERATTADAALDALSALLERHGQGGSGEPDADDPYFSSFMLVDAHGGWVVETTGRAWAARPVGDGTSISNRISLGTDWTRAAATVPAGTDVDTWRSPRTPTGLADGRLAATRACAVHTPPVDARTVAATLRHHGERPWGAPGADVHDVAPVPTGVTDDWTGVTVCMHVRDYQATTASMITELSTDGRQRAWFALGNPCASVFLPAFPPDVPAALGVPEVWERFAHVSRAVEADPDQLANVRNVLGPVEADLWAEADLLWDSGDRGPLAAFAERCFEPVDAALSKLGT